jgi:4-hydroxybenzoate polyprenyltransferase/putative flippase GtrA
LDASFGRFLVVGGIAAMVNWLSRFAFSNFMGLGTAVVAAYLAGMTTAYTLARLFVFESSGRDIHAEYVRFAVVNALALAQVWAVTIGLARYGFPALGWYWHPEGLAHAIGLLSPAITSYLGHRHFTFAPADGREPRVGGTLEPEELTESLPLVVNLDGTLLRTNAHSEAFVASLFSMPMATLFATKLLLSGRATYKRRIAELAEVDVATLPIRPDLLDYLIGQHAHGRKLHLVTAGDQGMATNVAARFGVFASVHGSVPPHKFRWRATSARLRELFPGGFAYAGNSPVDMHLWQSARSVILAGTGRRLARKARALRKPVEAEFQDNKPSWKCWFKALRLHQWSKNALLFVPFALSPVHSNPYAAMKCVVGFLAMGIAASATYLLNDLADLQADRRHQSKRFRPVANGDLPITWALTSAVLMLTGGTWLAMALSWQFGATVLVYVATTLGYSFWFKRVALLDVMILGSLYTLRLVLGTLLVGVAFSPWLLTFAAFFFFSLSLAKRHVEIITAGGPPNEKIRGRGYMPSDSLLTLTLGIASGVASILIVVQYLMAEAFPSGLYHVPLFLWAAPAILCAWICRIWLLAHRGTLHADPVAFAVRDPISLGLGGALGVAFALALTL